MQILPTTVRPQSPTQHAFASAVDTYKNSFGSYLDNEAFGLSNESTEQLEELNDAEEKDDVYARHPNNNATYSLDEVCFTQEELTTLYNDLLKNGATKKSLTRVRALTDLPGGANLGQVLKSVRQQKSTPEIEDADANEITSFADAIDPSGVLSSQILQALYDGKPMLALEHLQNALDGLPANEGITVAKNEVLAFGRALGIDKKAQEKLADLFQGQETGTATPAQMKKLIAPALEELLTARNNQETLDKALAKTLTPLLNKAKKRMEQEAQAYNEKNREAAHSQVMIEKTVQQESRKTLHEILDAMHTEERHQERVPVKEHMPTLADESVENLQHFGLSELDILRMKNMPQDGGLSQQNPQQNPKQQSGLQNGTKDLFQKIRVSVPQPSTPQMGFQAPFSQMPFQNSLGALRGQPAPIPTYVSSQVESGMLSLIQNGTARLDLQLHPQELGTIAITLISRNGEVSAHIKADSAETVDMLNRQAETIKLNLEQQGIKIDSLEIELQENKQQTSSDQQFLSDMQQRHSFQEENTRRDELRRLRTLANLGTTEDSVHLEQNMQSPEKTTTSATRILDRVA